MFIKYIDKQFANSEANNSTLYYEILANNLSISQIILYYYFLLLFPEMETLINKHNFFKRLDKTDLIDEKHKDLFDFVLLNEQ